MLGVDGVVNVRKRRSLDLMPIAAQVRDHNATTKEPASLVSSVVSALSSSEKRSQGEWRNRVSERPYGWALLKRVDLRAKSPLFIIKRYFAAVG
jgi:hypothetical protein